MHTQLILQSLFFNPPSKQTALAPLTQPYVLGYAYLTRTIYPCEDRPNLNLYEKSLYILIGTSLLIPIVNTIMYVALRILCSYKLDKAPYIQGIEKIRDEAYTASQRIKDPLIKNDIQDFINEIKKNAQQLIEASPDIDLCCSLTENARHELLCTKE